MPEILSIIMESGILLIIAAVFIWDKITISKAMLATLARLETRAELQVQSLEGLARAAEATSAALSIAQTALSTLNGAMERHDKRAELMNADLRAASELLKNQPCMMNLSETMPGHVASMRRGWPGPWLGQTNNETGGGAANEP